MTWLEKDPTGPAPVVKRFGNYQTPQGNVDPADPVSAVNGFDNY